MNVQAIVIGAIICGLLGLVIGSAKGYAGLGLIIGTLLGPLGLLLCVVMKPTPAIAAAREEAIEAERARIRAQRDGATGAPGAERPADS